MLVHSVRPSMVSGQTTQTVKKAVAHPLLQPRFGAALEKSGVLFGAASKVVDLPELGGIGTRYDNVVVLDGRRTPFGDAMRSLKDHNEIDLAVIAAKGAIAATGVDPAKIRESIWGVVGVSSAQTQYLSRDVSLKAGAPIGVTSHNVNKLCGSGIKSVEAAASRIANLDDTSKDFVVLAGGTESMTNAPFASFEFSKALAKVAEKADKAANADIWANLYGLMGNMKKARARGQAVADKVLDQFFTQVQKSMKQDMKALVAQKGAESPLKFMNALREGLTHAYVGDSMIDTAENLRERFNVKPDELDAYAELSQHRSNAAREGNKYATEIVPVLDASGKVILAGDELHRNPKAQGFGVKREKLKELREKQGTNSKIHLHPEKGVHTAAHASRIVDGAAAVLMTNVETAQRMGKTPLGKLIAIGEAGVNPHIMGYGASQAAKVALKAANLEFKDIDLFEVNEAFAGVAVATMKDWSKTYNADYNDIMRRTNVNGGAIAIGHPLGASGTRLIITMLKELERQNKRFGLVTACIGGGQGISAIVENTKAAPKA